MEHSPRDMHSERSGIKKMVTTWWDLVDYYLVAVMFAVSVASVSLQATQDRLICIPAVNCSDLARDDSLVRQWSKLSNLSYICNRSQSFSVFTTMPDRRQYDYVDNECYKRIHWFSAYYSLFFLGEAVILIAISNFWLKFPFTANVLDLCHHLLSEFMMTGFSDQDENAEQANGLMRRLQRWLLFTEKYSQKISKLNPNSVTVQYRLRGVVGLIVTIAFFAFDVGCYSLSTEWTLCHLDGHVAFFTGHIFFQCTRSMGSYYPVCSILVIALLFLHLILVFFSFVWSVTGERRRPKIKIDMPGSDLIQHFHGDTAFMLHLMHNSNYGALLTQIVVSGNRAESDSLAEDLRLNYQGHDSPSGSVIQQVPPVWVRC
ncbi:volume-regulated anion channel subunit LRRC8A-like [Acropora muricata]|uniref:volume-regulated anion channel subunit LRRC8A-like n=1 Tax=Acropora muricata TaxID=159855 RepID=UPI0034E52067